MIRLQDARKQLNISAQGLDKWINKFSIERHRKGKFSYIAIHDFEKIREARDQPTTNQPETNQAPTTNQPETNRIEEITFLQQELQQEREEKKELLRALDQEQKLHGATMRQLNTTQEKMKQIEHNPQLDDMIQLLETTRDSFVKNMALLGR